MMSARKGERDSVCVLRRHLGRVAASDSWGRTSFWHIREGEDVHRAFVDLVHSEAAVVGFDALVGSTLLRKVIGKRWAQRPCVGRVAQRPASIQREQYLVIVVHPDLLVECDIGGAGEVLYYDAAHQHRGDADNAVEGDKLQGKRFGNVGCSRGRNGRAAEVGEAQEGRTVRSGCAPTSRTRSCARSCRAEPRAIQQQHLASLRTTVYSDRNGAGKQRTASLATDNGQASA